MENLDLMSLKHKMLIATPLLDHDPLFANTVVYVYEHTPEKGTSGVIVNKPTNLNLLDVIHRLGVTSLPEQESALEEVPILIGGPMSREEALILQRETVNRSNTKEIVGQYLEGLTEGMLEDLILHGPQTDFEIVLGYSGWNCGILEQEIVKGFWLLADVDQSILFHMEHDARHDAMIEKLGIDMSFYMTKDGHG